MTQASTLQELKEIIVSANMVFSIFHSGEKVEKNFQNLQVLLTKAGPREED